MTEDSRMSREIEDTTLHAPYIFVRLPDDLATACYDMSTCIASACKALLADIFSDFLISSELF